MKNKLLLLFIIPLFAIAQQKAPIDNYAGIKLGSTPDVVKQALIAKGAIFNSTASRKDTYFFSNVAFNDHQASMLLIKFYNNKFYQATLIFPPSIDDSLLNQYQGIIKELNIMYGDGSVHTDFEAPYHQGDGNEIYAIKNNKASYFTTWASANPDGTNNTVIFNIGTNLAFTLSFIDGSLIKQKDDAEAQPKPLTKPRPKTKY